MNLSQDLDTAIEVISTSGDAMTAACRAAPGEAITACPGWDVAALVTHVGNVHAWATANLNGSGDTMAPFPEGPAGLTADELGNWADVQRAALIDSMRGVEPDALVWAFRPETPARFWWRRQAHETALHAWDATAAIGEPYAIPGDVAVDGVDELLDVFVPRGWKREPPEWGQGRTVHLHRTDHGVGEWLVEIGSPPVITRGHAKGDLAVRGSAVDLLLWLTNRRCGDQPNVELLGDAELASAWKANFHF